MGVHRVDPGSLPDALLCTWCTWRLRPVRLAWPEKYPSTRASSVGTARLERVTSTVSRWRSNQLSYARRRRERYQPAGAANIRFEALSRSCVAESATDAPRGTSRIWDARQAAAHGRIPTGRSAEADGDLVGQQAPGPGQHHPLAVRSTSPSSDSTSNADAARPIASGAPAAGPRAAWSRRRGPHRPPRWIRPLSIERDVAVGRADVPPPPAVAVRVGGAADALVLAHRPVEEVVPALVAGAGPVGDLVPAEPGRAEPSSATRYLSAWSSSSGWRAGSSASGVPGLDGEGVGRHVRRVEGRTRRRACGASRRASRRLRRR